LEATLLIEKFGGMSCYRGISPTVDEAEVTPDAMTELKAALIQFAQQHSEHPDVGSAVWRSTSFTTSRSELSSSPRMRPHLRARRHHLFGT